MATKAISLSGINDLVQAIQKANKFFLDQTQRQVNTSLTLRNWVIGYYIVEYEQRGKDRAKYGDQLLEKLAQRLKKTRIRGLSFPVLHVYVQFYRTYPQILLTLSREFQTAINRSNKIYPTLPYKSQKIPPTPADILLNKLSFSHFVELLHADSPLKRTFYEIESIKNNWSVRELRHAMDSMLFERTDLEQAIIDHLQKFLLEMGRGFCFEARQKRITFDNTHYRIDLVFYHRLLRCHILIDLKMGKFTPADAGQMHMYLNYFKENEAAEGDNLPIGIILCTDKSETLVKYATSGLAQKVFVSKYMTKLPSEKLLQQLISKEREKRGNNPASRKSLPTSPSKS
ncbi:PDDEXK nuclease domain-containing protein [Puia dinghuensis]|uniref:YhcG PDDEXK nuclease domain-containing protein n=1 Tax=Puia dinghuensis TaxID=1792502 RepID=A0A8J2XVS5_9BACT|nr:PDDEXK nuclease domain-containing protein [Puia dinghuensis]GGB17916.1 hypothetical protein GCM10011511_47130 [Puia dinghuensis]